MEVKIEPLKGKYYGTRISLPNGEGITVWIMGYELGNTDPSQRQLEYWGMTLQEAKEDDLMCDSHYETQVCYQISEGILKLLNNELEERPINER